MTQTKRIVHKKRQTTSTFDSNDNDDDDDTKLSRTGWLHTRTQTLVRISRIRHEEQKNSSDIEVYASVCGKLLNEKFLVFQRLT